MWRHYLKVPSTIKRYFPGGAPLHDGIWRDLRWALRRLMRRRLTTATALIALGLGVGATTAIYAVLDAVVLHAIPGANSSRLVIVSYAVADGTRVSLGLNHDGVDDAASRREVFEAVAGWKRLPQVEWSNHGESTQLVGVAVTRRFFELFGVQPEVGRWFLPDEDQPGQSHVAVLSHSFWRASFGGDRSIVGRSLTLSGAAYVVVGIMPAQFEQPNNSVQVWLPDEASAAERESGQRDHYTIGLLQPGLRPAAVRATLAAMPTRLAEAYGLPARFAIRPLQDQLVGPVGRILVLLIAAVGLVLAVACGNVAVLQMVEHSLRERETAVRLALGASAARLLREALIESLLIGVGGVLGTGVAALATRIVRAVGPATIHRLSEAHINLTVLAVAVIAALVASLLASLVPAVRSLRVNLETSLGDGMSVTAGGTSLTSRQRGQALLVLEQLVLVTVLVVGSGLLLRSLMNLLTVDLGYNPDRLLAVQAQAPRTSWATHAELQVALDHLLDNVCAAPGVESAAAMTVVPQKGGQFLLGLGVERTPGVWTSLTDHAREQSVSDGFFQMMRMRVLAGRTFTVADHEGAPRVVVVNQAFAQAAWPGQSAVGQFINEDMGLDGAPRSTTHVLRVIGVVANMRYDLAVGNEFEIYFSRRQRPNSDVALMIRLAPNAENLDSAILDRIKAAGFAARPVTRMIDTVREATVQPRFYAVVLTVFAAIALVLAATGVYGVTAHLVTQRTHELGVRVALGARPQDLRWLVWRAAGTLAVAAIVAGLVGAAALTRFLQSVLFGVTPLDPLTFAVAPVVVAVAAFAGSVLPSRRAAGVDPVRLLRG
jgi:putative ABC transport system permease protein